MTACVKCSRALQPAWKFCIYCGTPVAVAASAPRSRPLPKRTPVPGYAAASTAQTPIVPPPAPAPLAAAPVEEPVSSVWPEGLGERPSLRSALAATDIPAPTPPVEEAPPPVEDEDPEVEDVPATEDPVEDDPASEDPAQDDVTDDPAGQAIEFEDPDPEPEPPLRRARRSGSRGTASTAVLEKPRELEPLEDEDDEYDEPVDRTGSVNTLAVLALLIGILACPLAAPFGHLALGQVKVSRERGVIPAWIAIVLGYLWLGFWIVFVITYFATNG